MALIIYPTPQSDSLISLAEADVIIANNCVNSAKWVALADPIKEVYLRIAFTTLMSNVVMVGASYDPLTSCLPKVNALMAMHDLDYGLSSEINPNTGLISAERVGDIEVKYYHGNSMSRQKNRVTSPYPASVVQCVLDNGGVINRSGINQMKLGHS